jgi:hypothetical protein
LYSLILITGLPIMIGNSEIRGTLSNDMRSTLLSMTKTPIASTSASELSSREWLTYPWMHEHVPTLLPEKTAPYSEASLTKMSGELIRSNVVVTN